MRAFGFHNFLFVICLAVLVSSPLLTAQCSYTLSATTMAVDATGGAKSVNVTAGTGCAWTASTTATWITIPTASATGTGNGTVNFTVAAAADSNTRTGTITLQGQTLTITQTGTTPTTGGLTATPASVTFAWQTGAALPAAQTVSVKAASGTPTVNVTTPATGADWLIASPASGKTPLSVSVRVNPTGLPVGSYLASITVTSTTSTASVAIPVTLTVTAALPTLSVSATQLTFAAPPVPVTAQTVTLASSGGNVSYTAAVSGATWLSVSPASGVILPGLRAILTVSVDPSALVPQTAPYTGKVTITGTGVTTASKTQTVTVSLTVNTIQPVISSIYPAQVPVNSGAATITLRGTNFVPTSVAKVTGVGTPLATTYVGPSVLLAVVPAALTAVASTLNLLVTNPAPGGDSATAPFIIAANPSVQAIVNAASFAAGPTSPGALVSLFGQEIGSLQTSTLADVDNNGFADTTLAGVTVTIDGKPAPLLLVSENQISVQVPYSASIGTAKTVSVDKGNGNPATGTVDIQAASPGIFTMDGSGKGQAAALTCATGAACVLNSASNAAKRGDTVVLYMTGQGTGYSNNTDPTNPLPYDVTSPDLAGYLDVPVTPAVPPLAMSTMPTVTIGSATAQVAYAGPVQGSILGLMQVNAVIPQSAPTGNAVAVSVSIGGQASQSGVTLVIK